MTTTTLRSSYSWRGAGLFLARASMLVNAAILAVIGFSLLDGPLYVPFAVAFWLGAAAMVGLAILTPFGDA